MFTLELIRKLREETGAGIMDCRRALEESRGDLTRAKEILTDWGREKADKKKNRQTPAGLIYSYIHHGGKVGALLELNCETDFVARTPDFQNLAKEIAMQVAGMDPATVDSLMKQEYIRDTSKTIEGLIKQVVATLGENIIVARFIRYELGKS